MGTYRYVTSVLLTMFILGGCRGPSVTTSSLGQPPPPPQASDIIALPAPPAVSAAAEPPAVVPETSFVVTAELPPGSWQRLQPGFRTAAAVLPKDLPSHAVKSLGLTINGQACPADDWTVEGLTWTAEGGILATLRVLRPRAADRSDIVLANATHSLYLRGITSGTAAPSLTPTSTALALLVDALGPDRTVETLPRYVVQAVANRVLHLLVRSSNDSFVTDSSLTNLIARLAAAIKAGKMLSEYDVQAIERGAGTGAPGGGGGSSGSPVVAPVIRPGPLAEAVTIQQTTASTSPLPVSAQQPVCQTFTAPGTGVCIGFEIDLASTLTAMGSPVPTVANMSLYACVGGIPSGLPLATTVAMTPPGGGFLSGPMAPVPVTGGQTYAIVVETTGEGTVAAGASTGSPYGHGQAMTLNGTWSAAGDRDLRFKVHLTP